MNVNTLATDRELAFNTIYSIFFENRLCHEALKEALDRADAQCREKNGKNSQAVNKAWTARLINGVTEHWLTLEYAITEQAARKAEKIKPKLRVILYMALYQAFYMHVPESAAVNEAVKLCKKHGLSGLSGFVNGVLRGLFRNIESAAEEITAEAKNSEKEGKSNSDAFKENNVIRPAEAAEESGKEAGEKENEDEKPENDSDGKKNRFLKYIYYKCSNLEKLARLEIIYSIPRFILEIFLESMSFEKLEKMLEELDEGEKPVTVYRLKSRLGRQEFEESLKKDGVIFTAVRNEKTVINDSSLGSLKKEKPLCNSGQELWYDEACFFDGAYRLIFNTSFNNAKENVSEGEHGNTPDRGIENNPSSYQGNISSDDRENTPEVNQGNVPNSIQNTGDSVQRSFPDVGKKKKITSVPDLSAWKKGWFIVQDYSSMLASELVPIENVNKVLDVCAAPGGKTIHLADRLLEYAASHSAGENGIIEITACDISEKKISKIRDNLKRTGFEFIKTEVRDASVFCKDYEEGYDVVVADLPCSGLGVIGRKPDIKYKTKKEDIETLAQIQRKILSNVSKYVKKGGILAYSTCTVSKSENDDNAEYIKGLGFEMIKERKLLPGIEQDGFYISVFRKEERK